MPAMINSHPTITFLQAGCTPLHIAARFGTADIMRRLLAEPRLVLLALTRVSRSHRGNSVDYGSFCFTKRWSQCVDLFLQDGRTALDFARAGADSDPAVVSLLEDAMAASVKLHLPGAAAAKPAGAVVAAAESGDACGLEDALALGCSSNESNGVSFAAFVVGSIARCVPTMFIFCVSPGRPFCTCRRHLRWTHRRRRHSVARWCRCSRKNAGASLSIEQTSQRCNHFFAAQFWTCCRVAGRLSILQRTIAMRR